MTRFEEIVGRFMSDLSVSDDVTNSEKQMVLDRITMDILRYVSAEDLVSHTNQVYDSAAEEYANNPHTEHVIDELIQFMFLLPNRARVLDVGCGLGRDTLYMSVGDEAFRIEHMGRVRDGMATLEKFRVPQKTFDVTGIDSSFRMIDFARSRAEKLIQDGLLTSETSPLFDCDDMHDIYPEYFRDYNGIWSCAALFTHTPAQMMESAMESVSRALKIGGILFVSYTNGIPDGRRDKLLLCDAGRIEYFSQPDPSEVAALAKRYGMTLKSQTFSDFEARGRKTVENLFVSQFFKKV